MSAVWSKQYTIQPSHARSLRGDKIILPATALEQLLAAYSAAALIASRGEHEYDPLNSAGYNAYRQSEAQFRDQRDQLPHPLTFRLVNPRNGRIVYAGVQEFSAEDNHIGLSTFLRSALALKETDQDDGTEQITVHAQQLPKGTFVKLRPLEAGYDPDDWKALLEQHLRSNYTTLTKGEILQVDSGRNAHGKKESFRFLVDGFQPESEAVCVVDTDLEVDIEALNEEQARETLARIAEKLHKKPGTDQGSSAGGSIDLFKPQLGQVLDGEYVDYELSSWSRDQPLEIELEAEDDEENVDLLVSPYSATQRNKPRLDEFVIADLDSRPQKRIKLEPTNDALQHAEALFISVHAYSAIDAQNNGMSNASPRQYTLRVKHSEPVNGNDGSHDETERTNEVKCKNCKQWVPKQSLVLHENFCLRNNILCPKGCGQVFQARSPAFKEHWHCQYDSAFGNHTSSFAKHSALFHPAEVLRCSECSTQETFSTVPGLAHHHTTNCPAKLILCRYCHLIVPQEGDPDIPSAEVLLSGMTQHELLDGARTTECHMCSKIIRLRDMETHLKSHDLDRLSRPPPQPCRNVNCGRTLDTASKNGDTRAGTRMGQGPGNDIELCNVCFGPLYVSMYDPENKALKRRIERRYLQQLLTGCGKSWCQNEYCKIGRGHASMPTPTTTKDALPLIKSVVEKSILPSSGSPLHFCVDEPSQKRRKLAEMLAAEKDPTVKGGYAFEWCLGAVEAETGDLDGARQWLKNWAPTKSENDSRR